MFKNIGFRVILVFLLASCLMLVVDYRVSYGNDLQLADVSGHLPDLQFNLISDNNQSVTQDSVRGDIVLLFFGFTSCPDECPATMMRLQSILAKLGKDANHVRVLFVTVDHKSDTPQILHDYLQNFDAAHMTGLTGTDRQIRELTRRYRAAYQSSNAGSGIVHADGIYVFDYKGRARLLVAPSDSDQSLIHDLRLLISEAP